MSSNSHTQICNLCEAMCGLDIDVIQGKVSNIKGNPNDTFSKGHLCAKAWALKDIHEHKDRLHQPIRKTPQGWRPISWQVAFNEIERELQGIKKKYGPNSIGLYLGNPRYHHHGSLLASILLKKSLNSKNSFSVASSDHLPHMLAAYQLFGHMAMLPVPDIDRSDYLLCIGVNPLISNGSVMSAPYIKKRLIALQSRGGRITTIDPQRTQTAELADKHIFIYPGQDTFLLIAIIQIIFTEGLLSDGRWQSYVRGISEFKQSILSFDLKKLIAGTGIDEQNIRTLAYEFTEAKHACAYGRMGLCSQKHGAVNIWLIYILNIISGNLDEIGGLMFPLPAVDLATLSAIIGKDGRFNDFQSRQRNLPSFDAEIPVVEMADEMISNQEHSIRAFINISGNPVLSTPDGKKLECGLEKLEYMIAVDSFINETNQYANIILPPTSPLERSQYNLTCNLTAIRNNARYSPPLFIPTEEKKHDWEIFLLLSDIVNTGYSLRSFTIAMMTSMFAKLGPDRLLDTLLKLGPYGTSINKKQTVDKYQHHNKKIRLLLSLSPLSPRIKISTANNSFNKKSPSLSLNLLKNHRNGIDLDAMSSSLPGRLFTEDKMINIASENYLSELQAIRTATGTQKPLRNNEFYLIGRRTSRAMNSWLNRIPRLNKGKPAACLIMNTADALSLNLKTGDKVRLSANHRQLILTLQTSDCIMKKVISLPHGWGSKSEKKGSDFEKWGVGRSFNDLSSSRDYDPLSGMSTLNALIVKLSKIS